MMVRVMVKVMVRVMGVRVMGVRVMGRRMVRVRDLLVSPGRKEARLLSTTRSTAH